MTCLWLFIISMLDEPNNDNDTWIPINLRNISGSVSILKNDYFVDEYYKNFNNFGRYAYCLYSIIMMVIGSEMGPINSSQVNKIFIHKFPTLTIIIIIFILAHKFTIFMNNKYIFFLKRR